MSIRAATKMARIESPAGLPPDAVLFGHSSAMNDVRQKALKICRTNVSVLMLGEGGTGKEVLARWLHANSHYANGEFGTVNMPRLAERREDIPQLAEYFRNLHSRQFDKKCEPFGPELLSYMQNLSWQGNLRELSNCIARYIVVGPEALLQPEASRPRGRI